MRRAGADDRLRKVQVVDPRDPRAPASAAGDEEWAGIAWHTFWGFLNNILLVVISFAVIFGTSLMKVVVAPALAFFFAAVIPCVLVLNLRSAAPPQRPLDVVGLIWPLSYNYQVLLGLAVGIVTSACHQTSRLHVHHDTEEEPERYFLWLTSLFGVLFAEAFILGVLTDCGPNTLKDHSE